jgi:hypothetical protein
MSNWAENEVLLYYWDRKDCITIYRAADVTYIRVDIDCLLINAHLRGANSRMR